MEFRDYYEVLGIDREAAQDEIKRAYRKLARKYHPDVSSETDAEDRFKQIGEAYEVLKDPEKRAAYDELGENWQAGQDFRPPPGWDQGFEFHGGEFTGADAAQFSDFFESLFGRRSGGFGHGGFAHQREQPHRGFHVRGEDTYAKVQIEIEDSYRGHQQTLELKHSELGVDGRPHVTERTLNVQIPRGIRAGQHIRLAGQGAQGLGDGGAGDLFLEVEFKPHRLYRVEDNDVYLTLPVAPWEAAMGAKVTVPIPSGSVDMTIPPGSSGGHKLRLKSKGIPSATPGDLYVVLQIALPIAEDEAVRKAYETLENVSHFDARADLHV
ncbi:MAG: DnaJ C-terminal domain-containing protein [Pseudomonadota bacterium]